MAALSFRYRAKIFSVSVNVISNLMHMHCLLMLGSELRNDFPLILIIIGNVLRLQMEFEPSPLKGYRRAGL
jgi:hypothetical protein